MPLCRAISSRRGLWEVRTDLLGGRMARVLVCVSDDQLHALHGFIKKTRKTPDRDLDLAEQRMKELKRHEKTNNPHAGSSLEELLREQGTFEETQAHAVKAVLAWQLRQAMDEGAVTKSEMARRMGTSRAHLDRLLDPENDRVQLDTMLKAAQAVGRELRLELV